MGALVDLTGQRFGLLTVVRMCEERHGPHIQFETLCDCGTRKVFIGRSLREGAATHCGCARDTADNKVRAGMRFGRLTTVSPAKVGPRFGWLCQCDCGHTKSVGSTSLVNGCVQSCGCLRREVSAANLKRLGHGKTGTPTWASWTSMKTRCTNPNASDFHRYGGRGIAVCDRWLASFDAFLEDMGERPAGKTIDRIDNDRGYEPGNCRWATPQEQARNSRTARMVTINGKTQCVTDWCAELGITMGTYTRRLSDGWPVERALSTPVNTKFAPWRYA